MRNYYIIDWSVEGHDSWEEIFQTKKDMNDYYKRNFKPCLSEYHSVKCDTVSAEELTESIKLFKHPQFH